MPLTLRQLTLSDVPEVHRIETETYLPVLLESPDAFVRYIAIFPEGAWGCWDHAALCGFGIGVPVRTGTTIELRHAMPIVPADADTFYVHDVAVLPGCRGRGVARLLVERLLDIAQQHGYSRCELVSVQGSAPFWERFGFRAVQQFEYVPGAPSTKMTLTFPPRR